MKNINSLFRQTLALIFIFLFSVPSVNAGNLFSRVDKNIVNANQTITLIVEYDDRVKGSDLNLDELKKDFEVLSIVPNSLSSTSNINGQITKEVKTTWRITLAPKREGQLTIPSFTVNGDRSQVITIDSRNDSNPNTDQSLKIFISADSDSVYQSSQLVISVEVHAQQGLSRLSLSPIETNEEIRELGQDREQVIENGIIKDIFTNRYVIFPSTAGKLTIPATTITAIKGGQRSIFGQSGGEQLIARSEPFEITIKPIDKTYTPWFPAQEVIIEEKWSANTNTVIAGEPISRGLTISALGQQASAIPPLTQTNSDQIKSYKDQPSTEEKITHKGLIGQRIESEAIVFSSAGEYTLPAVTVRWWNTKNGAWQEATVPEKIVKVLPGSSTVNEANNFVEPTETVKQDNQQLTNSNAKTTHWLWPLISALLFAVCLIQAFLLWKSRNSDGPKDSYINDNKNATERDMWLHLQQSFKTNDLIEIRQSLHRWAQSLTTSERIQSINNLEAYLSNKEDKLKLSNSITELERCLYKEEKTFDSSDLFDQLQKLRKEIQSANSATSKSDTLAPLYNT